MLFYFGISAVKSYEWRLLACLLCSKLWAVLCHPCYHFLSLLKLLHSAQDQQSLLLRWPRGVWHLLAFQIFVYPVLDEFIGFYSILAIMVVPSVFCTIYLCFTMIETKGKSSAEIFELLKTATRTKITAIVHFPESRNVEVSSTQF